MSKPENSARQSWKAATSSCSALSKNTQQQANMTNESSEGGIPGGKSAKAAPDAKPLNQGH
ncbi:MAG: hypothetical protein SFV15_05705 [Polyangiaceae bacterium]|nr:hypothetical protein [Polyangiaceae bacterium]